MEANVFEKYSKILNMNFKIVFFFKKKVIFGHFKIIFASNLNRNLNINKKYIKVISDKFIYS